MSSSLFMYYLIFFFMARIPNLRSTLVMEVLLLKIFIYLAASGLGLWDTGPFIERKDSLVALLGCPGSVVATRRLTCSEACGSSSPTRIEPVYPALQAEFLTTVLRSPGLPLFFLNHLLSIGKPIVSVHS